MNVAIQSVPKVQHQLLLNLTKPKMDSVVWTKLSAVLAVSDEVYVGLIDGEYVCCWGLIPPSMMSDKAYLWLQTTPEIEEYKFLLVRHSQRCVEVMLETYEELVGFCTPENTQAIKWIEWLGGEFKPLAFGRRDFVIRRKAPKEALCG